MKNHLCARDAALKVLVAVDTREAYSNLALRSVLDNSPLGKLDRAFVAELVYGTLRRLNTIDWILGQYLRKPVRKQSPRVRNILRLGAYQIIFLDRVPDSAACNEAVEMAKRFGHRGTVKFVNGVLRNIARGKNNINFPDPKEDIYQHIALKYSHPLWLVRKWINMLGIEETIALCRANNESPPFTARVNTLKTSREEMQKKMGEAGAKVLATPYAPEGLILEDAHHPEVKKAYAQGLLLVQDESSMLAAHALSPLPGRRVLDMASAPGGKTTHLAQLMQNRGHIVASDFHAHKLDLVRDNCRRLGISIVETWQGDSRQLARDYAGWAHFVLLDAPCSGFGVIRRRPDIKWRKNEAQLQELISLQAELLQEAGRCLAPGGVLVYSTCTINEQENIKQVKRFLTTNRDFDFEPLTGYLPSALGDLDRGYIQLLPHRHGTDGFFIARLRKKRNPAGY